MTGFTHTPVLLPAVLEWLQPRAGGIYIDATLGGGGHATALLEQAQPDGRLLGIDADPAALATVQQRWQAQFPPSAYQLVHHRFERLADIAADAGIAAGQVAGILFDLGVSSHQLDTAERGFSFQHDAPLDMRLDPTRGATAADLIAELRETDLANIIYHYGEERMSRRIAQRIVAQRTQQPITTTQQLATLVAQAVGGRGTQRGGRQIHPATRTFQALRIAVNRELEQIEHALPQAVTLLERGGRLAVISFHSLEDRIVKQFFRDQSGYDDPDQVRPVRLRVLTRKPIIADAAEQHANPRSRSAKLRVAERV